MLGMNAVMPCKHKPWPLRQTAGSSAKPPTTTTGFNADFSLSSRAACCVTAPVAPRWSCSTVWIQRAGTHERWRGRSYTGLIRPSSSRLLPSYYNNIAEVLALSFRSIQGLVRACGFELEEHFVNGRFPSLAVRPAVRIHIPFSGSLRCAVPRRLGWPAHASAASNPHKLLATKTKDPELMSAIAESLDRPLLRNRRDEKERMPCRRHGMPIDRDAWTRREGDGEREVAPGGGALCGRASGPSDQSAGTASLSQQQ